MSKLLKGSRQILQIFSVKGRGAYPPIPLGKNGKKIPLRGGEYPKIRKKQVFLVQ